MKTATNSLKQHLAIQIQNQRTLEGYPDSEDKSQSMAVNAMRIEAGIMFLRTPYSGK